MRDFRAYIVSSDDMRYAYAVGRIPDVIMVALFLLILGIDGE